MHTDRDALTPFLRLRAETCPCPACRSESVTVRKEGVGPNTRLTAACADCGFTREVPHETEAR